MVAVARLVRSVYGFAWSETVDFQLANDSCSDQRTISRAVSPTSGSLTFADTCAEPVILVSIRSLTDTPFNSTSEGGVGGWFAGAGATQDSATEPLSMPPVPCALV